MDQLAKSLMQCKSFKERQQNLNEALDYLSFQYSHVYILMFREMKKREMEYNDSNKITKWLSTSKSNSYVKLHEGLLLVKSNNIIAMETYLINLIHMLNQAIKNGSNIEDAVKICYLIEKSPHLSTVYENLKHLIQTVKQMKNNKCNSQSGNMNWNDRVESTKINDFEQLKFQSDHIKKHKQQKTTDWPTILQSTSSNLADGLPYCSLDSFGYDYLEMIATGNQLNHIKYNYRNSHSVGDVTWNGDFKSNPISNSEQYKMQCTKQQQTPMQPSSSKSTHIFPHFNLTFFGYGHFEITASANRQPDFKLSQSHLNLTIVSQDMDGAFIKWLNYLKFHKYQWFFNGLSYLEIECIDADNIEGFISKVDINSIPKGAQKKICISVKALRDRQQKFKDMIMSLDLEVTLIELCDFMTYMQDILHYPIPNKNCVVGDQLQQDIVLIMEKALNQVLEKLANTEILVTQSLLGTTINKFLECTFLIIGNQTFMSHQIEKTIMLKETLKYKVSHVPRYFN